MLQAASDALCAHLETVLANRSAAVTAEPPLVPVTAPPDGVGAERGIGVHLFHVAALDQGRGADAVDVRDEQGRVIGRRPPVNRYRTRWLLWSWALTAQERLELLDVALALLTARPVLPEAAAGADLIAGGPVQVDAAPALGTAGELGGVFAGLKVPSRPALEIVLTAGLVLPVERVAGPPTDLRVTTHPRRTLPYDTN
ncbi:Pvc16 family protein [Streptomyces vinaceus]|uniref:Pvc16 family protein n=1 Tax=Streptomyces vinaceus TaxID=1960 RepID=UPI0035E225B3